MVKLPDLILPRISHFGISIERTVIRGVQVDPRTKVPIRMSEVILQKDAFQNGILMESERFTAAVRTLLETGKFSTPYVAVTFPEAFAYTRGHTVPAIPVEEIGDAIKWKARDLFPFPTEELYFDWKLLSSKAGEHQVLVVAVQRIVLDGLVGALEKAGLKPLRFEPDASAIAKLIRQEEGEHTLLVEINPRGAYVTLVEGEQSIFTTTVPYAPEETPGGFIAAIDQTLGEVTTYYREKGVLVEGKIKAILAGEAVSKEWVAHVSEMLKIPTSIISSPVNKLTYNKSYVAACQEITPPDDPDTINLLPKDTQDHYDVERHTSFRTALLSRVMVVIGLCAFVSLGVFLYMRQIRSVTETEISRYRSSAGENQLSMQPLLRLNALAKQIVTLSPFKETPVADIVSLIETVPDGIVIQQWEYDDTKQQYKVIGTAATRDALLQFRDVLEENESFSRVTLPIGTLELPIQVPFVITFFVVT